MRSTHERKDILAALRTGFVLGADWLREEIEAVLDQYTYEGVDGFSYGPEPEDVWRMVRDLKAVMKGD